MRLFVPVIRSERLYMGARGQQGFMRAGVRIGQRDKTGGNLGNNKFSRLDVCAGLILWYAASALAPGGGGGRELCAGGNRELVCKSGRPIPTITCFSGGMVRGPDPVFRRERPAPGGGGGRELCAQAGELCAGGNRELVCKPGRPIPTITCFSGGTWCAGLILCSAASALHLGAKVLISHT